MEETISLKELFQTLRKRMSLIIVITLLAVTVSGIISYFFLTPIYQASTQILVNQSKDDKALYDMNQVQTNLQLINTYNVIIKSPAILEIVSDDLMLNMKPSELNGKITVSSEQDSQVINVTVQDQNPDKAVQIANKTAEVFQTQIVNIMKVDNVKILAKADAAESQSPVKPKPLLNIAIALVVGLMAGVGLAFLLEYMDSTVKSEKDIEQLLELPVLGVITIIGEQDSTKARSETVGS
ncbi:YveK family protein [Peribacillus sp. SCS-155]|uniref:YveK family protein n=1 Tax=Peribacillus sedimenti TaxID=3115297 RepID=UPI003906855C